MSAIKPITRTTDGVNDVLFNMLETTVADTEIDSITRVKSVNSLVNSIHKMARLDLEHRRFQRLAPGLAAQPGMPIGSVETLPPADKTAG